MGRQMVTIDGNEAASRIAHKASEVCIIYPITPSSPMGENADLWSSLGQTNLWGTVPDVVEMQSEGGASGAMHGAVQTGALASTFTASQGLLLMLPNMFKIAGELTSTVFHVSARSVAAQALSIFGDHSDVMACRGTGFAMLASGSIQEAHDMAMVAHAATLESRVPFLHFFDGFRSSHEVNKIEIVEDEVIRAMIKDEWVYAHRMRALNPDQPVVRGTAQNPDVFFQARETVNPFYEACPDIVQATMDRFAELTGRAYHCFDYLGAPDAEKVVILMASGTETARETVDYMTAKMGEKVGVVAVHLYRPFAADKLLAAIPETVKAVAVLDRTKEPGCLGEPLYQDVINAYVESDRAMPVIVGGRYGLSSKEFTPAMIKGVFDNLDQAKPKNHFTIGIVDDVTNTSLDFDPDFITEGDDVVRAMFFGLGADGTVGANKNSIKIIGGETDNYAQGYFVYDSKKSGSQTVSHLRFGPKPIRSTYLIQSANFVGCHQFQFLQQIDVLKYAAKGGVFLLNSPFPADETWDKLPRKVQQQIIDKQLDFYVIDAYHVAEAAGMSGRVNTVLQTCFFAIANILPRDEAIAQIKKAIKKTYGRKGEEIVKMNYAAVDHALANMHRITVPETAGSSIEMPPVVAAEAPQFVQEVTAEIMARRGDDLPVSKLPADGTYPLGTTKWEKRNVSLYVPIWDPDVCIQCGSCALVCPHACIRMKQAKEADLADAPAGFKAAKMRGRAAAEDDRFVLQVFVEDCTGCTLCVDACPAKNKKEVGKKALNMGEKLPILEQERAGADYFEKQLECPDRTTVDTGSVRGVQYLQPLFEFSGACAGCGETPYVSLMSKLFGDRAVIANATGCSSIYGGNLPTTPWTVDKNGRGPAWSNSLFEDNAEFGFGFRVTLDKQQAYARELVKKLEQQLGTQFATALLESAQTTETELAAQRQRVDELRGKLAGIDSDDARQLLSICGTLVKRSVWIVGGDGWAYDIGYGGLDHVLASGRDVNILVLDTEVYSNTGGQMSKATPRAAVAKFAAGGKPTAKKDLGMMAMCYGYIYVAKIALFANQRQAVQAFIEAENYPGPSLILAYSNCIAHGYNMANGPQQQDLAVKSGHWPLFRYDPRLADQGRNPLTMDSKAPSVSVKDYAYNETRYTMLTRSKPEVAAHLIKLAQEDVDKRWKLYEQWAAQSE